jgi:hypothetical protein
LRELEIKPQTADISGANPPVCHH